MQSPMNVIDTHTQTQTHGRAHAHGFDSPAFDNIPFLAVPIPIMSIMPPGEKPCIF